MTNPTWELVKIARTRAMADRLQQEGLDRADAAGFQTGDPGHYGYAFGWLAHEAARRIVELEDARHAHDAQSSAAHEPPTPPGGAAPPFAVITGGKPRASRK